VLRTSNAIPVSLFLGFALASRHGSSLARLERRGFEAALGDLVGYGVVFLVVLLPWLLLLRQSVGTLIYPLSSGNMTPGFSIVKSEEGIDYNVKHVVADLLYDRPFVTSLVLLAAGLAPLDVRRRRSAPRDYIVALVVSCVVSLCLTSYVGGTFDEVVNARYYFAFLVATVLAIVLAIVPRGTSATRFTSMRALLVVGAVAVHVGVTHDELRKRMAAHVEYIDRAITDAASEAQADLWATQDYRDVQGHVPEGARIAVAVDEPFRFDMRRNEIWSLDQPGAMGPKPGFPVHRGPDALSKYLLDNGVRWLVVVDFHQSKEFYDIDRWRRHTQLQHSFLAYEAPIVIDAMESIEALGRSRLIVYKRLNMSVIDLATRT